MVANTPASSPRDGAAPDDGAAQDPPPNQDAGAAAASADGESDPDEDALANAYYGGIEHEKAGRRDEAISAYRQALALDPYDRGGVAIRLAALGAVPTPERASPSYVATLFDQHADVFDHMLVEELGYDAPMQLREALIRCATAALGGPPRFQRLLDLGCGTGLCAEALDDHVAAADGVDLSEEMIAVADEKDVYEALYIGDAAAFLETAPADARWDLIVATDVLPYLGDLAPLLTAAAARLSPQGWLAMSTETLPEAAFGDAPYTVGPRHRFAHRESYLRERLAAAGLVVVHLDLIVVRYDEGQATPGHLVIARAPG